MEFVLEECRQLYNAAIQERRDAWRICRKSVTKSEQERQIKFIRQVCPEVKEVYCQVLHDVIDRVNNAFNNFFHVRKGYPRFKSKKDFKSFTYPQIRPLGGFALIGSILSLGKIGNIKIKLHRKIVGEISSVTLKNINGNWFACFDCEVQSQVLFPSNRQTGIDLGLTTFLTTSEGETVVNPRFYEKSERKLRTLNRRLSRRKKGSNRRKKVVLLLVKFYEKLANSKTDFLHKLSTEFVRKYGTIVVEELAIKQMIESKFLSKQICSVSWAIFLYMLAYKAESAGRLLVKVDPRNTSQICSGCDTIVKKDLSVRQHNCQQCGLSLDRDHNAARNILKIGLGRSLQTLT